MQASTVLIAGVAGAAVAAGYLAVGALVVRRAIRERRAALVSFSIFWLGIGFYALVEAAWILGALAGVESLAIARVVLHLKIVGVSAGFAGLVAYLVRLYTGRTRLVALVGVYYAVVFALLESFYAWREPIGQHSGVWGHQLEYARASPEPAWTLVLLALLVPPVVATVAYASLLRVTRDPLVRRRILLTSASLLLFLLPTLLTWRAGGWYWWGLFEKGLGALAALGMLSAAWQAHRHGRMAAEGLAAQMDALRTERQEALIARARDLV